MNHSKAHSGEKQGREDEVAISKSCHFCQMSHQIVHFAQRDTIIDIFCEHTQMMTNYKSYIVEVSVSKTRPRQEV